MIRIGFLLISLLFSSCLFSQETAEKSILFDKKKLNHSANKAVLLSLVPGAGQIYNGQAWKVPIIYVAGAGVGYFAITNYQSAQKFKKEYKLRANGITEGRNPDYINYPDQTVQNLYFAYQKNFELSILGGVIVYLLNLVDAMVYGHLYSYDISDDLSMRITPYTIPSLNSKPSFGLSTQFFF